MPTIEADYSFGLDGGEECGCDCDGPSACCGTPGVHISTTLSASFSGSVSGSPTLTYDAALVTAAGTHPWKGSFTVTGGHTVYVWYYCVPTLNTWAVLTWCNVDVEGLLAAFYAAFGCQDGDENYNSSADFDSDNDVDDDDFDTFADAFGSGTGDPNYNPACDFDSDGQVDGEDLAVFDAAYGSVGPDDCYDPDFDFDFDGDIDGLDLAEFYDLLEDQDFGAGGTWQGQCNPHVGQITRLMGGTTNACVPVTGDFIFEVQEAPF